MTRASETQGLVPTFDVRIDGRPLPSKVRSSMLKVTVQTDVEAPGMFALHLVNWDPTHRAMTWSDADLFAIGGAVEIMMGYVGKLAAVISGEITGLEPEFCADELPMLTVRGYDPRHRLMRGRRTRSFRQMKDSDIAQQVAGAAGLAVQAEDTQVQHEYVLQHNQTDLEFLAERARRIGYEITVQGKTLVFRPSHHGDSPALALTRGDLLEFYPRLTTLSQVGSLDVRGWNPTEKAVIMAAAGADKVTGKMGGAATGPAAADEAFGASSALSTLGPAHSRAEAEQAAAGRLNDMALAYVTGDGACVGRTDLQAGTVVALQGLGKRFSGPYYVTAAVHSYSPQRGYRTAFQVRRNAA